MIALLISTFQSEQYFHSHFGVRCGEGDDGGGGAGGGGDGGRKESVDMHGKCTQIEVAALTSFDVDAKPDDVNTLDAAIDDANEFNFGADDVNSLYAVMDHADTINISADDFKVDKADIDNVDAFDFDQAKRKRDPDIICDKFLGQPQMDLEVIETAEEKLYEKVNLFTE